MEFNGKRVKIPWENWETVEISPADIHTFKGIINQRMSQIWLKHLA